MDASKRAQQRRGQDFKRSHLEQAKTVEWFHNTCQFHYELEQLIRDSLFTITETENEARLLRNFIKERNKTRVLHGKDDLSGVFGSIMKAQPLAQSIVECMEAETISFTVLEVC